MKIFIDMLSTDLDKLLEGIAERKELGEVNFIKSELQDPHIKAVIAKLKHLGVPEKDIDYAIHAAREQIFDASRSMPTVYHRAEDNFLEGVLFRLLETANTANDPIDKAPKWSLVDFNDLHAQIELEHKNLFPLRNHLQHKSLRGSSGNGITKFSRGAEGEIEINGRKLKIPTAAHTANGYFIFNIDFMQNLLNFAHLKGVKPTGKKYKNNGGEFDPEWCYIEFVILHEYYHYIYGDLHYKTLKEFKGVSGKVLNWATDFRINYDLVKDGFEQLPIGLFNDKLNLDRQRGIRHLVNMVNFEMSGFNRLKIAKGDKIRIKSEPDKVYEVKDVTLNDEFEYDFDLEEVK